MALHRDTFECVQPTAERFDQMQRVQEEFTRLLDCIDGDIPEGPDKTYLYRKLRECAMWANVAITRNPDGSPRQ